MNSMTHKLISRQDSIDILIDKLRKGDIFTFVRYGDGDYKMMYNGSVSKVIGRSNKFLVTKKFRKELIDSYNIEDDNFLIATVINDLSKRSTFKNINESKLPDLRQRNKMLIFSCLMDTFIEDIERFKLFAEEMCKTSTMFVCNYNHPNLEKAYGEIKVFVKTPKQNSYSDIENIYKEVLRGLDKVDKIVLSAGQSSRIIAKRLYETSKEITVIDVGSVSDMLIMNTPIINNIPQRSHLGIYRKEILKSLKAILGDSIKSELVYLKKTERKRERNREIINRRRER